MDQTKKTMRHFYCRDVLWETFEGMANDFDCSIDYLVNESMRLYARSKNYQVPGAGTPSQIIGGTSPGLPARSAVTTPSPTSGLRGTSPGFQSVRPASSPSLPAVRPPSGPHFPNLRPSSQTPPSIPGPGGPGAGGAPSSWSPPLAPSTPPAAGEVPAPPLYLVFNGQRFVVDKDQFVIGRGSKTADLPIKDGNISRKHAVVIRRAGIYYIKDLGSTNGIEYKGMRIDNKRIDEGDVFSICDYELRFTYQG